MDDHIRKLIEYTEMILTDLTGMTAVIEAMKSELEAMADKPAMIDREKQIATYYGYDIQSRQTCEELAELMQAICKHGRMSDGERALITADTPQRDNVKEEMADVQIMLDQMQYLLMISDEEMDMEIDRKLARQMKRMEEEGKEE